MGIGLSVSRSIIESHHGRLWAAPNDGPGATFAFSIPEYSGDGTSFHTSRRHAGACCQQCPECSGDFMKATRPLVSVVDDDESVRESLPDLLREFGFASQAFSSAEAFLASDSIGQTRCLILDVAMPGMTGPDLQRELTRRGQSIPIVFITAQRDDTVRPRLLEQGAVECLFKPFSDAALQKALELASSKWTDHRALLCPPRGIIADAYGLRRLHLSDEPRLVSMPHETPIVFVVDDDISVRESLELLIRSAGWQPEIFESAQEFLAHPRARARTAWCWTSIFRISTGSTCRSSSPSSAPTCRSSSSPATATCR